MRSRRRSPAGVWLFASDTRAAIFSCGGPELSHQERDFFRKAQPFGFILMGRNCENPAQVKKLTQDLRDSLGRDCPILIDQEGGRVQRLKPPHWRQFPPYRDFGELAEKTLEEALETIRFETLQIAEELRAGGINVNCAPVVDVLREETHDVIGDRAFSPRPDLVSRLGLSVCRTYLAAGITPIIKHIPGHGRATADSHKALPKVKASSEELAASDFLPFKQIAASDIAPGIWGMTAHVVYSAIDADHPATMSEVMIGEVISKQIGFDGFLLGDDVEMDALKAYGDLGERAAKSLKAGCDAALYCAGKLLEMEKIADSVGKLGAGAIQRLQKAAEFRKLAA
jgi:beta-N-acetylhexosaminidase